MLDTSLVDRARDGDVEAFDALARQHSRRLFLVAHRIVRDTSTAEDALQQTLTTIWRELPRLREASRFEASSYRVVTRAALAELKRARRHVEITPLEPDRSRSSEQLSNIADRDEIERAFEALTPEKRAVIVLRFYADLPVKEIGYALGIPPGTVKSRLNRAISDMRAAIDPPDRPAPPSSMPETTRVVGKDAL